MRTPAGSAPQPSSFLPQSWLEKPPISPSNVLQRGASISPVELPSTRCAPSRSLRSFTASNAKDVLRNSWAASPSRLSPALPDWPVQPLVDWRTRQWTPRSLDLHGPTAQIDFALLLIRKEIHERFSRRCRWHTREGSRDRRNRAAQI